MFYGDLFNLWFDNVPANQNANLSSALKNVEDTFRNGGYYRWDLNDNISLLSFNSIFGNFRDKENDPAEND
jgi:hypothetical protein